MSGNSTNNASVLVLNDGQGNSIAIGNTNSDGTAAGTVAGGMTGGVPTVMARRLATRAASPTRPATHAQSLPLTARLLRN